MFLFWEPGHIDWLFVFWKWSKLEAVVHTITNNVDWKNSWGTPLKNWDKFHEWVEFVANDEFFDMVWLFWKNTCLDFEVIDNTNAHGATDVNWTNLEKSNVDFSFWRSHDMRWKGSRYAKGVSSAIDGLWFERGPRYSHMERECLWWPACNRQDPSA